MTQRSMSDVDYDNDNNRDDDDDDDDNGEQGDQRVQPKKGGYDSRVEQFLYENPASGILITYAGKNLEGGGGYIAYTINTGVRTERHY